MTLIEVKPLTSTFEAEIKGVDKASSSAADFDEVLGIFCSIDPRF